MSPFHYKLRETSLCVQVQLSTFTLDVSWGAIYRLELRMLSNYASRLRYYLSGGPTYVLLAIAGRFRAIRSSVSSLRRLCWPPSGQSQDTASVLLEAAAPGAVACSLEADGVYAGLHLTAKVYQEIREALLNRTCYGEGKLEFPFSYREKQAAESRYGRRFMIGHYYELPEVRLLARLAGDPLLFQIARCYLGIEPVFVGMRAWWSFASGASADEQVRSGQRFHYDIEDYKALSVFFYLTDVDGDSGPHVCIRGSHKDKTLRHILSPVRRRTDDELLRIYGSERMLTMCGVAGFGFAEDTFCFHKGLHPRNRDRLILQLRYAMKDYGMGSDEKSQAWMAKSG